jgi:hypothetical protein
MAKPIFLILLFLSLNASANLFDFGTDGGSRESKIPGLTAALKKIEIKDDPAFEDSFNQAVKALENGVEEEKLYCAGESQVREGKSLPASQKQLCMRELKKHYLEATSTIFELKKKYLGVIHKRHIERLTETQTKQKADIEKNF